MKSILFSTAATLALAGAAIAEVPSVATDIPPIHALVATVMDGVGTPNLIVRPGASPHAYSLRPSEATALQNADIVFWVSEGLTPWLEDSIHALAKDAKAVELLETEGTVELAFREGATFESHEHEEEGHDEDHDAHGHDPHAWLDPENARIWLDVIATELATLDPENAETYATNAAAGKAELAALITEIDADLEAFRGAKFIVFHDAYQYFENRFDIAAVGAISLGDASAPSPARVAEIRDTVVELGVACAFTEPQFNPGLLLSVFEGTGAVTGVLDPLGSDLEIGPDLYVDLIKNLASNLGDCLK
ncbi:MAG: zinc ABC transporter substrate-binding protein [Rhodobacteraceae bacterium]|nr:zinc ABC transporter substrate-binding protein [Paracoccaceae bacterium]